MVVGVYLCTDGLSNVGRLRRCWLVVLRLSGFDCCFWVVW